MSEELVESPDLYQEIEFQKGCVKKDLTYGELDVIEPQKLKFKILNASEKN